MKPCRHSWLSAADRARNDRGSSPRIHKRDWFATPISSKEKPLTSW
jgi:hypothetical protein